MYEKEQLAFKNWKCTLSGNVIRERSLAMLLIFVPGRTKYTTLGSCLSVLSWCAEGAGL